MIAELTNISSKAKTPVANHDTLTSLEKLISSAQQADFPFSIMEEPLRLSKILKKIDHSVSVL